MSQSSQVFFSGKPFSVIEIPSAIRPDRNVVIVAKYNANNKKTGLMVQISILDTSLNLRKIDGSEENGQGCSRPQCSAFDGCYVRSFFAHVGSIDKNLNDYRAGTLPKMNWVSFMALINGLDVRLGEFGDPAAMGLRYVEEIARRARKHTGYTHRWKSCDQDLRFFLMASVENQPDYDLARKMGWKCFYVGGNPVKGDVMQCPNEGPSGLLCNQCGLCKGANAKFSISIEPHGQQKKKIGVLTSV